MLYHAACDGATASGYTPAQRGLSWLKLKRDYLEGLADSLDLVPIGAWHGQGRKVRQAYAVHHSVLVLHSHCFTRVQPLRLVVNL
jgi:ATP-dependent DNA ligase